MRVVRERPVASVLFSASALCLLVAVSACGRSATVRAATGGIGGALIAGPAGAVVGGTVGAATAKK